ncbi:hypothetical protein BJX99DRAFT_257965 [Aspergillus californicus]
MAYTLSIIMHGPGITSRAHWGFIIHKSPNTYGNLLHVRVIDIPSNRFIFEHRSAHGLEEQDSWGLCKITELNDVQRLTVISVLEKEKPPLGGAKDCQDWVVDALVALEVEELVPDGTVMAWNGRLGMETERVKGIVGRKWTSLNGH